MEAFHHVRRARRRSRISGFLQCAGALLGMSGVCTAVLADAAPAALVAPPASPVSRATAPDAAALLRAGDFDALERYYSQVQQRFRAGALSSDAARDEFRAFYSTDAALAAQYAKWIASKPHSYVAQLARGIYYKRRGMEFRGSKTIGATDPSQIAAMHAEFAIARSALRRSAALDSRPFLSYLHAIDLERMEGDSREARRIYDLAVRLDPGSFALREKYLESLRPRWGGSLADMDAFLRECESATMTEQQRRLLLSRFEEERGWVAENSPDGYAEAVRAYLRAAELAPEDACGPCGPLDRAASLQVRLGRFADAIAVYDRILAADAKDLRALDGRGHAKLKLGKVEAAIADLTVSAEAGDAYAQTLLAKIYLDRESGPEDRALALRWLQAAAAQGDAEAKKLFGIASERHIRIRFKPEDPAR